MAPIAVAFAILDASGSAADLGLVLAAGAIPTVVFLMVGGVLADRIPRARVMACSDAASFLSQGALALLLLNDIYSLPLIMLTQAVAGTANAFFRPASAGLLQQIVPAGSRQRANALLSSAYSVSTIAGPGLAAGLIALVGAPWAVAADAFTFLLSGLLLWGLRHVASPPAVKSRGSLREAAAGIALLSRTPWLRYMIAGFALVQLAVLAPYSVLGPKVSVASYDGAATWAAVGVAGGVGALLGDISALRFHVRRPLVLAAGLMGGSVSVLLALAVAAPTWILVLSGALFGFCLSLPNVFWYTALQDHVPGELMSRVSAIDEMGSMVLRPVGLALIAPVAAVAGTSTSLICASFLVILVSVTLTLHPAIRNVLSIQQEPESAHGDVPVTPAHAG